jgi:hypothetical protein
MEREVFELYLRKGGRSESAVERCLKCVSDYENFLIDKRDGKCLEDAQKEDLEQFVEISDRHNASKTKIYLWGIKYYYDFLSNDRMAKFAGELRADRITRKPFLIKDFRGVDTNYVNKLNQVGIRNADQMIDAGKTPQDRKMLSEKTGIPENAIDEFVKLSDLSRIPGIKGIRARLYYDIGIDSVEKLGSCDPEKLRKTVVEYVEQTGFDGISTLPAEARAAVRKAKNLPKLVEYD